MARPTNINRLLRELRRQGGGIRRTTLRVLGGKLAGRGAPFVRERLEWDDPREGPRTVDIVETSTCSFGHTVDDKVRVAGICEIGGEVLCSTEGCLRQCERCGIVVCRAHSLTRKETTYCRRCRWAYYWRLFWGLT